MATEEMKQLVRTANDPTASAQKRQEARAELAKRAASGGVRSGAEKRGFGVETRKPLEPSVARVLRSPRARFHRRPPTLGSGP